MCRNIRTLANFDPPATDDESRASALQFVRKLSGSTKPSRANETAFNQAVEDVTAAAERLIHALTTTAPPRTRHEERPQGGWSRRWVWLAPGRRSGSPRAARS